jgi:hypothetical protein
VCRMGAVVKVGTRFPLHKFRNLWHSFTEEGGPCEFNTSATKSGGFTG